MAVKALKVGLVSALVLVLVGGTAYILTRPTEARAGSLEQRRTDGQGLSRGSRGISSVVAGDDCGVGDVEGYGGPGQGEGNGVMLGDKQREAELDGPVRGGARELEARGRGLGNQGDGTLAWAEAEAPVWETVQGVVIEADSELLLETSEGELLVGLGQAFYREEQGFEIAAGDEVMVKGYVEDDEFKAGTVENLTTEESIVLRDDFGRPMWSGRGNNQNRP